MCRGSIDYKEQANVVPGQKRSTACPMRATSKPSRLLKNSEFDNATGLEIVLINSEIPPTGVGGLFRSSLQRDRFRNLGIPPTEVCGLFRSFLQRPKLSYLRQFSW